MILEPPPNIVKDLPISCQLMDRWRGSLEEFARYGWESGLQSAPDGGSAMELTMEPQDVLHLRRLYAIGERGWPLLVDGGRPEARVEPFDASRLGAGRYDLFVCLARQKSPSGEVAEFRPPDGGELRRYQRDLRPVLTLAVGQDRLPHRDWLQVGILHRTVMDGIVRSQLDPIYHPPIRDMAAYLHANPLPRLAENLLLRLADQPATPLTPLLRAELKNLAAIAEKGHPQVVFMKTHLCLALARELIEDCPPLRMNLDCIRYSRETFCWFLQQLAVEPPGIEQIYPEVLLIDGVRHLRIDGEFAADGDFWVWRPGRPGFVARAMALYMPHALANVPWINYGHHREEAARWPLAPVIDDLAHPGAAVSLSDIQTPIEALYLRTNNIAENQNLRLKLGEGHAIYYQ